MPWNELPLMAIQHGVWLGMLLVFAVHNIEEWFWIARRPLQNLPWKLPASLYAVLTGQYNPGI